MKKLCTCTYKGWGGGIGEIKKTEFPFTRFGIVNDLFLISWYCNNVCAISTFLYVYIIAIIISLVFREGSSIHLFKLRCK